MNKYTFTLIILAILALVGLIWSVNRGNTTAAFVLGIILAIVLILIGFGLYAIADNIQANREQRRFMANTTENIGIATHVQTMQSQQNKMLLDQIRFNERRTLPAQSTQPEKISFDFDDAIFEELDSEEAEL